MAMILPERTVDAWTATYITGRRWRARMWAPTEQMPDERYDLGVGLGRLSRHLVPRHPDPWPDKVFVLEHKGVDETSAGMPFVLIRGRQLAAHLIADRGRGGRLVYYVLPDPEWRGRQSAPYGVVPDVAARRTRGPMHRGHAVWGGFQLWAVVVHVEDVAAAVRAIGARSPSGLIARPPRGSRSADFWCALQMPDLHRMANALNLRDFISGVRDCTHGRLITDPGVVGPASRPRAPALPTIGPSRDDLLSALGIDAAVGLAGEDATNNLALSADELSALIDRPPATTYYGIGDSDEAFAGDNHVTD